MTRLALIVMLVACGGSSKRSAESPDVAGRTAPADPIPSTPGPACSVVAEKLSIVALSDNAEAQPQMRDHVKARCTADKWSDEARNCFATVETDQEIEGCKDKLTAEQRAAIGGPHDHGGAGNATKPEPASTATKSVVPAVPEKKKPRGGSRSGDPCEGGE
jgi:hypothetical protein